jgi:Bacterial Ig domain
VRVFGIRRLPVIVAVVLPLALTLALAPTASGATLFSNLDGGAGSNNADATQTTWLAQSFVPTSSGTARLASFWGVAYFNQTTSASISIYTHSTASGGQPGTALATGTAPTIDDETGPTATCTVLNTPTALTAGQTYWAVLRSTSANNALWLTSGPFGATSKVSTNSGGTWSARPPSLAFSLRVDDNASCAPDINPNPIAGVELGDMYAKPGGTSFQTLFVTNNGTQQLNLTGGSFSGPNASMFKLLNGEPAGVPPGSNFTFPKSVGTGGGGVFFYIVCAPPLGTADGEKTATFTVTSNDPDEGSVSWPVWCLLDSTPPSLEFTQNPDGRNGWFITRPAPLQVRGIDPESGNRVKRIFCSDNGVASLDWPNGSVASFAIQPDGIHALSCQGTDVANNTSAPGAYTTTVKVDTAPPETTKGDGGPPAVSDETAFTFPFTGSDGTSGVQEYECRLDSEPYGLCASPASRSGLGNGTHTFDVRARDVAGNYDATPVQWSWQVDAPPPLAADDALAATADTPFDIDVLANDVEPRGGTLAIVLAGATTEMGGAVSLAGTRVRYVPPPAFVGTDRFSYRVVNGTGLESAAATVTVQVAATSIADLGDTLAPVLSKAKLRKRRLSFRLSEPARTTVVVNEIVKGRKKPIRRGKVKYVGRAGSNKLAIPARLLKKKRRYRLVITAVDAAGNASKAASITVRVR